MPFINSVLKMFSPMAFLQAVLRYLSNISVAVSGTIVALSWSIPGIFFVL